MGERGESGYRLYNCQRCAAQVRICRRCDHGNRYCAAGCSRLSRRESLRRAGVRYQRTYRGALGHAARQRRWRERREAKVTHQGYRDAVFCRSVADHAINTLEPGGRGGAGIADPSGPASAAQPGCAFCRAPLPAWTRLRQWFWSG